ncbi:MAG: HEAT repeat domain-containing protein [Promethearchaeota archaeon]
MELYGKMDPTANEILLENLNSSDVAIRKKAVFEVGSKKIKEFIPNLIQLLKNDEDSVVRNSAARSLGKIKDKESQKTVVGVLVKALQDPDYYVKFNACWALGKLKDKRAISGLASMVNPKHRVYTMIGDGKTKGTTSEDAASRKMREEGVKFSDVIVEAIKALGKIQDKKGTSVLIKALGDEKDGAVRCAACLALAKIGNSSAINPLIELLKNDKYWYVRRDAIFALGKLNAVKAAPEIAKKTLDMYDEVREYAVKALITLGKPAISSILEVFLRDKSNPVLKNFIEHNYTSEELAELLPKLIKKEKNSSKKVQFQQYLAEIESEKK